MKVSIAWEACSLFPMYTIHDYPYSVIIKQKKKIMKEIVTKINNGVNSTSKKLKDYWFLVF